MTINWLNTVDSTNKEAARHIAESPEGNVWVADFQTAGRGQQQNTWESERGKNLLFSLLLRPEWLPATEQFYISKIVSLGIYDFLSTQGIASTIKWPNDGYVGDKKIAGILIENHLQGNMMGASIIGIGLNVNQQLFQSGVPNPTSIFLEKNITLDLKKALPALLLNIMQRYEMLREGNVQALDCDYLAHLYRFGEWHWYEKRNIRFRAKIKDVKQSGELVLQDEAGAVASFAFKEISFVSDRNS